MAHRDTGVGKKDILVGISASSILQYLNHMINASAEVHRGAPGLSPPTPLLHRPFKPHPPPNSCITNQVSLKSPKKNLYMKRVKVKATSKGRYYEQSMRTICYQTEAKLWPSIHNQRCFYSEVGVDTGSLGLTLALL